MFDLSPENFDDLWLPKNDPRALKMSLWEVRCPLLALSLSLACVRALTLSLYLSLSLPREREFPRRSITLG